MSIKAVLQKARRLVSGLLGYPDDLPRVGDWSHSRAPLVDDDRVMQSHTHAWLRGIPNGVHPKQLCRHYPRIANRIAVNWQHLHVVERLLTDLLVDQRGDRKGFPPRIRQEIERLYSYHAKRMTPLLRGRAASDEPPDPRMALEPVRRTRLRSAPMAVSSIKR
ncbi:MAG: hypothetical protein KIT60_03015 [Burkholderiaceae bacterium]|nr:hypothetical protein [Burkholderiaceae bacterium]